MFNSTSALEQAIMARHVLYQGRLIGQTRQPQPPPLIITLLNESDLPALEIFRRYIFNNLPDLDIYIPEADDFTPAHLGQRGITLGAWHDNQLIACAVLGLPRPQDPAFVHDLSKDAHNKVMTTAHMASCMVASNWRGHGLQHLLLALRTALAIAQNRSLLLARIALTNLVSLNNLLDCGFIIRRLLVMHGGTRLRFLLSNTVGHPPITATSNRRWIALSDIDGLNAALTEGWIGIGLRHKPAGPGIEFSPDPAVTRSTMHRTL